MKSSKLIDMFKDGNLVIPMYLLKNYKKFQLELNEFIFLMYLYNHGDRFLFNPNLFAKDLNIDLSEVMQLTSDLTDKGLVSVEAVENDKEVMEDIVVLENFYQKFKLAVVEDINKDEEKKKDQSTIYEEIEKEFGRTLSSIEYELIRAWIDQNYSEEIIREALKEAVLNGVSNLKYIDKILYEWEKNGIKTVKDVDAHRKKRKAAMGKNKELDSDIDLESIDWDWFDADE